MNSTVKKYKTLPDSGAEISLMHGADESTSGLVSRRVGLLTLLASALAMAGCGGGGGGAGVAGAGSSGASPGVAGSDPASPATGDTSVAGVSSGGTGSVSVGSVTGFGSIIVNGNGVRIDDASATITDEDGNSLRGALKLGMQVVSIGTVAASGAVTAQSIVASGELLGRIENLSPGNSRFFVLGQQVQVVGSTVFDASLPLGFASLVNDDILEIHGLLDAKHNILTATFIERKPAAAYFKIIGFVSNNSNPVNSFKIGNLIIISNTSAAPARDSLVRVRLNTAPPGTRATSFVWQATRISGTDILAQDRDSIEIQGRISAYTSAASFSVDGVPVVVPSGVVISNSSGVVLDLALATTAALVEVKGRLAGAILTASSVKVESETDLASLEFELHGTISNFAGTSTVGSFTLAGSAIDYNGATVFTNTGPPLANGVALQVNGTANSSGIGTRILATKIKFE